MQRHPGNRHYRHHHAGWVLLQRDESELHVKRFLDLLPQETFQESTARVGRTIGDALAHSEQTAVEIYADLHELSWTEKHALHRLSPSQWNEVTEAFRRGEYVIVSNASRPMAWGAKVSPAFRKKVIAICGRLDTNPDYLMACMAFESGRTFDPAVRNAAGSGAVGLIQFMPSTATALGTSTSRLAAMTAEDQLDYVERYFTPHKGHLGTLEDIYMVILWPAAVGKAASYVLFTKPSKAYDQNAGLDANRDGTVTKYEAASAVRASLAEGSKHVA